MSRRLFPLAAAVSATLLATAATATPTVDPTGDFLATYTGPAAGDLDVTSIEVLRTGANFDLYSTFAAPVGTTTGAFYVWGIDRGAGTARFGALATGVLFDSVLVIRPGGTSTFTDLLNAANNFTLAPGAVTAAGNGLRVTVAAASLPSTGALVGTYTFNLWPRATGPAGTAAISDFAPNNSNVLASVPEPASWAMLLVGFGGVGIALRRRPVQVA